MSALTTPSTLLAVRRIAGTLAGTLALAVMVPLGLRAQGVDAAPSRVETGRMPNGEWCFGAKLRPADRCGDFFLLEMGARFRATGQTDHSTRDPAHAYPTLGTHAYLGLGLARRLGPRSALGGLFEAGAGGGERLSAGIRFDQQLAPRARTDLTGGVVRVETNQHGVTRRRNATGVFVDGAIRASDLAVIDARFDHIPGDGRIVRPANAAYIGMRVEGTGAVKTTIAGAALVSVLMIIAFFGGFGGD